MVAFGANDDPVGPHEILNGRAFSQEFGVRGDIEAAGWQHPLEDVLSLAAGADRHCRLGDHDRARIGSPRQSLGYFGGGGKDVSEIGMTIAAPRRRPDRDEYSVGPI